MGRLSLADVLELSVSERIQLAEDIWDSVATMPEAVMLTDAQRQGSTEGGRTITGIPKTGRLGLS